MISTTIVAWWGAGIATLVLIWDIFKWNYSGARVKVTASPNMEAYGGVPSHVDDQINIVVEVTNVGNQATTITHLGGYHYKNRFLKLFNKRKIAFSIYDPGTGYTLPYLLKPGERWVGCIPQTKDFEERSRNGFFLCGVNISTKKRFISQRVIVHTDTN